jgi:hypothetical protein
LCALQRVQVAPLDVLDEGQLKHRSIADVGPNDSGNALEAGQARRSPPPLPGDQLEPVRYASNNDGLQHAVSADAITEFFEGVRVEHATGLLRVRAYRVDSEALLLPGRCSSRFSLLATAKE